MKIIILGIQGSGKGTQAHYLATDYGLTHIAAGDLLRTEEKKNTKQGLLIKNSFNVWKILKKDLLLVTTILAEGWKKERKSDSFSYMG